uniref:ribosomal protein L23 n=1 Tax=Adiantum flabellulatum TaxID=872337 RepID=UPI002036F5CF|nr:ribosomal protein L23 [Adiantum flabellulatum]URH13323.1 ribosomal protein L23 [Adiantum flabellulatum]
MDQLKNQVITGKSIRLLQQNQYTFQVDLELTKTGMKNWVERFFDVKVKGTNSSRMRNGNGGKRNKLNLSYISYKKMVVRLKKNYFIPSFVSES